MSTILILEDNEDCITIYQDFLQNLHQLIIVRSLHELGNRLKTGPQFDLLIADMKLKDGMFLEWLVKTSPEILNEVPVFVVSSLEDEATLTRSFEWGIEDYLVKPFRKSELLVKLNKALGEFDAQKKYAQEADLIRDRLTAIEAKIFHVLFKHLDTYVSRQQLVQEIWKKVELNSKSLDVHFSNMRKKLHYTGWTIQYQQLKGWKLTKV